MGVEKDVVLMVAKKVSSDMVSAAGMVVLVIAAFPTLNAQIEDLDAQEFVKDIKMNNLLDGYIINNKNLLYH